MTYKTIVIDYAPKAKKMATAVEQAANKYAKQGWKLVTFSITNSAKAILAFSVPEIQETIKESTVVKENNETSNH